MQQHRKTALLFLAPFLTVFVAFYLAPVVYAIYLSLFIRKRVGIGPAKEVFGGLANYFRAVQDGGDRRRSAHAALQSADREAAAGRDVIQYAGDEHAGLEAQVRAAQKSCHQRARE